MVKTQGDDKENESKQENQYAHTKERTFTSLTLDKSEKKEKKERKPIRNRPSRKLFVVEMAFRVTVRSKEIGNRKQITILEGNTVLPIVEELENQGFQ